MNKARRAEIGKAIGMLEEAKAIIETAQSEEQEYYDNMAENFQQGEKGQAAETAASNLQEAMDSLDEIINQCVEAQGE